MSYKKKTMVFPYAKEIVEYHTARYGAPGEKRGKKIKPTREMIDKINQRNREKICRWKLRQHFNINDYFVCFTFKKDARPPDMEMAKEIFRRSIRKIRDAYRKRGYELKWIRNIEVGTKNAWHIHMVINRIPDTDIILKKAWNHGKVVFELLYEKGEFRELAAYLTKTTKTDPRLRESSYSTSRNLPLPEPDEKVYLHWKTFRKIKVPEGYYLDKESFYEGVNPKTGYKYREYTFLKIRGGRAPCSKSRTST